MLKSTSRTRIVAIQAHASALEDVSDVPRSSENANRKTMVGAFGLALVSL